MANKDYILAIRNPPYYSGTTYVIYTRSTMMTSKGDMSHFTKASSQVLRGLLFIYIFITSELSSPTLDYPCCFQSSYLCRHWIRSVTPSPNMCLLSSKVHCYPHLICVWVTEIIITCIQWLKVWVSVNSLCIKHWWWACVWQVTLCHLVHTCCLAANTKLRIHLINNEKDWYHTYNSNNRPMSVRPSFPITHRWYPNMYNIFDSTQKNKKSKKSGTNSNLR